MCSKQYNYIHYPLSLLAGIPLNILGKNNLYLSETPHSQELRREKRVI